MLKLQHTWSSNVQYTADVQVHNAGVPHFGETPMVMAQASLKGHMFDFVIHSDFILLTVNPC